MHACGKKIIKESGAGFLCVSFFADFIFRTKPDFLSLPTKVYLLGLLDTWRCIFCNRKVGKKEQQDLANMYTDRLTWRTVVVFGNAVNESFFCEKKHTFQHATFGASCCSSTLPAWSERSFATVILRLSVLLWIVNLLVVLLLLACPKKKLVKCWSYLQ